jgi:hypothetical protein
MAHAVYGKARCMAIDTRVRDAVFDWLSDLDSAVDTARMRQRLLYRHIT